MLDRYVRELGMSDKESDLYLWLVRHGVSAPRRVATGLGRERTSTYRLLQDMVDRGYVFATTLHGVKAYGAISLDQLKSIMDTRLREISMLTDSYAQVSHEYDQLQSQHQSHIPTVKQYEGKYGIEQMYQDMLYQVDQSGYIVMRLFASKTFEAMAHNNDSLSDLYAGLMDGMRDRRVVVHALLGQGMSMMEEMVATRSWGDLDLPTSNNATALWVLGSSVYLLIAKAIPVGIKIDSDELAMMLQFVGSELEHHKTENQSGQ